MQIPEKNKNRWWYAILNIDSIYTSSSTRISTLVKDYTVSYRPNSSCKFGEIFLHENGPHVTEYLKSNVTLTYWCWFLGAKLKKKKKNLGLHFLP